MTLLNPQVSSTCSNWVGSFILVRAWGLEPQRLAAREPKSRMSANFIMPAYILLYHISFTAARRKFIAMRACEIYNEAARDL